MKTVIPEIGKSIEQVCETMVKQAKKENRCIQFGFNGVIIAVTPYSKSKMLVNRYYQLLENEKIKVGK